MGELHLRTPSAGDWPDLLGLANRSVADVEGATSQELWAQNRQSFFGERHHWIAEDATGEIVGYAGVERRTPADLGARIFVVTEPSRRGDIGNRLLSHALNVAREHAAPNVWMIEYATDQAFLAFLEEQGFREERRITLPDGAEASVMVMRL